MSNQENKLLVCDLDGTLLDAQGKIDQESLESIKSFCKDGGHFVICTGRMDADILYVEEKLGFKSDFRISQNGTVIKNGQNEIISLHSIDKAYIATLNRIIFSKGLRTEVSNPTNRLFPSPRNPEDVAEFVDTSRVVSNLEQVVLEEKEPILYLTFGKSEDFEEIRQEIEAALGKGTVNIVMTSPSSLEVFSNEASKGIALKYIQKLLAIDANDTFVAGDAQSDVSMFAYTKHAFAVQEADSATRQQADKYVKTVGDVVNSIYEQEDNL